MEQEHAQQLPAFPSVVGCVLSWTKPDGAKGIRGGQSSDRVPGKAEVCVFFNYMQQRGYNYLVFNPIEDPRREIILLE